MNTITHLSCRCGKLRLDAIGAPIVTVECCCNSCREAAGKIAGLPGAASVTTPHGTVAYVMQRKDRVRFLSGMDNLREYRLNATTSSRRVVATCCNTPVFLEFKGGHWLSLYAGLWPADARPVVEMRTMAGDLPDPANLPADVPNMKGQGGPFMFRLLGAWIAMGFRSPKIATAGLLEI